VGWLPASGSTSGSTGSSCSPCTRMAALLVASTARRGHASSSATTAGAAARTCSKLSNTSSRCFARSTPKRPSCSGLPSAPRTPAAFSIAASTSSGSRTVASGTKTTPSVKPAPIAMAACSASRVLPTPPVPVSVSRRVPVRSRYAPMRSTSRPRSTIGVSGLGSPRGTSSAGPPSPCRYAISSAPRHPDPSPLQVLDRPAADPGAPPVPPGSARPGRGTVGAAPPTPVADWPPFIASRPAPVLARSLGPTAINAA